MCARGLSPTYNNFHSIAHQNESERSGSHLPFYRSPIPDTVILSPPPRMTFSTALDLDTLAQSILDIFSRATDSSNSALWVLSSHRGRFPAQFDWANHSGKLPAIFLSSIRSPHLLAQHPHAMTNRQLLQYAEKRTLLRLRNCTVFAFGYIVPFAIRHAVAGSTTWNQRVRPVPTVPETLVLLETLAHTAAIALGHIISKDAVQCSSSSHAQNRPPSISEGFIASGFA